MANIVKKISKRIRAWFGYYNGPKNIYTGKGFAQGTGFDVNIETFEIRRFGIHIVKNISVNVDPGWLDSLKRRLEDNKEKQK